MAILGYVGYAFFSAPHARPFPSLMLAVFIAMACKRKSFAQPQMLLAVLLFILVVFGFRLRASYWHKQLKTKGYINSNGYSVFSTLDYEGKPWIWWEGIIYLEAKQYKLASDRFKDAYEYNPYNIFALNGMGLASEIDGNVNQAIKYYQKALRICPEFETVRDNLGRIR